VTIRETINARKSGNLRHAVSLVGLTIRAMAVWWEPTQAELADRNGESPFVLPEFLEESNFQHLYKAL